MIRGVIFDMDGTLTMPHMDFQALRRELGIAAGDIVDYMRSVSGAEKERVEAILHRFEEDAAVNAELQPGASEVIVALRARGIKVGLLTRNSRRSVETVCAKFELTFDATVTREDAPHKPSPEPVLKLAQLWGLPPAEMMMVGDYVYDLRCGHNAGAKAVLLVNGNVPEWAHEADAVIHRLDELMGVLDGFV